jgi:archaellum biogenesis protein FlaJ (TadC family)
MEGKYKKWQKLLLTAMFLIIVASAVCRCIMYKGDRGAIIMLSFVAPLFFGVLCVAALFPATWRMPEKSRAKIKDPVKYQENYTTVFVIVNVVLSAAMIMFIWVLP